MTIMLDGDIFEAMKLEACSTDTYQGSGVRYATHAFAEELLTQRYSEGGAGAHWLAQYRDEKRVAEEAVAEHRKRLAMLPVSSTKGSSSP